ncbi:hypothetical protein BGW38_003549 [Lunasporangiospora selenospora]|uniref:Ubiquitin-like domain-containing protein n=1 Tax=Lunasporangiospora selenospora TaxID=979761 RepID=A0A9P6G1A0_9FUNG|nr:hypothetical protein BGW38_003549 [Lunasporangiospora selenospora]
MATTSSTPSAAVNPESPITLNVKTLESQTHSVSVNASETVLQLKERLATMLELPSPRQRLIFRGRVLADEKPLTEYYSPQRSSSTAANGGLPRFDRDIQFSIIGVEDTGDPQSIMQALAGSLPLDLGLDGASTVIHIGGDPSAIQSLLSATNGGNSIQIAGLGGIPSLPGDATRASRLRALTNAVRAVPLGHSLPHLATIEAELTRAATQLRNVQTILSHPADNLEGIELEPLDIPELESVDEVDGDSTELVRMGGILTQLSETSRAMANHLQLLSEQYSRSLRQPSDRLNLQRGSLRAARAMYRLASVQNTVFPMLANATFVGTSPESLIYRFQPTSRQGAAQIDGPLTTRGGVTPARPPQRRGSIFRGPSLPTTATAAASSMPLGLIPSLMAAHARASAQSVSAAINAAAANAGTSTATRPASATQTTPASEAGSSTTTTTPAPHPPVPQIGLTPLGQMILGPNGTLSYSIQTPLRASSRSGIPSLRPNTSSTSTFASNIPTQPSNSSATDPSSTARFVIPTDFAGAGFMDFWRNFAGQTTPPAPRSSFNPRSTTAFATTAAAANTAAESVADAMRAVQGVGDELERIRSRRRERPDDFSTLAEDDRAAARRRLSTLPTSDLSSSQLAQELERHIHQEIEYLYGGSRGSSITTPSAPTLTSRSAESVTSPLPLNPSQAATRPPNAARSLSNETRRTMTSGSAAAETPSSTSSSSPSSPSIPSTSTMGPNASSSGNNLAATSPAYNLGRIGVFISAILRMVDQPREDGSPRTLADVICNDPEAAETPLQTLVRDVAESVTVRETRSIVEGHPAPIRNIHPVLNGFIRNQALNGQQLTESNLDAVAVMFAHGIMNAVHVEEILETLEPAAAIRISSEDIRRISMDVLREHFRRLIYLVVAAPVARESNWPTFARDVILWIRDVVGAWRVAFYGLFQERDQVEAQRIATHVVGSAIHANGRRWVELSNRATNTLVNVLCANIVPRRRGEEQAGGLVGGAWPLMATGPRQNVHRSRTCMAPSLLGSTAPPAPLGPSSIQTSVPLDNGRNTEVLSQNLTRRFQTMLERMSQSGNMNATQNQALMSMAIRDVVRAEVAALASSSSSSLSSSAPSSGTSDAVVSTMGTTAQVPAEPSSNSSNESAMTLLRPNPRRTRVEDAEDEEMNLN